MNRSLSAQSVGVRSHRRYSSRTAADESKQKGAEGKGWKGASGGREALSTGEMAAAGAEEDEEGAAASVAAGCSLADMTSGWQAVGRLRERA